MRVEADWGNWGGGRLGERGAAAKWSLHSNKKSKTLIKHSSVKEQIIAGGSAPRLPARWGLTPPDF